MAAIPKPLGGHNADPIAAAWWRDWALEVWASDDLEPFADEILAWIEYQKRTNPRWRQRGPRGELGHYVPTHWKILKRAPWKKRGPWTIDVVAQPGQVRAIGPAVKRADLPPGAVDATKLYGYIMQVLADPDLSQAEKQKQIDKWQAANPGLELPALRAVA